MARVLALVPDLLFGSRLQGSLAAAGHDVKLLANVDRLGESVRARGAAPPTVLIVDLTADVEARVQALGELADVGVLEDLRTLAFYSHVDTRARELAQAAGFELVVPRSRIAREGPELLARVLGQAR